MLRDIDAKAADATQLQGMGSSDTFGRLGGKDGGLNGRNLCLLNAVDMLLVYIGVC